MDAIRAAFESQFGTEWSTPVVDSGKAQRKDTGRKEDDEPELKESKEDMDVSSDNESNSNDESSDNDGPITIKHDETMAVTSQPAKTKSQRRKFMSSTAPKDDTQLMETGPDDSKGEDLKNDLALQRLIEESHILHEEQRYSGADISGANDPLDSIGKSRLKVMNARLEKAGAKVQKARIPQAMAVGIRDKASDRKRKYKEEARNAGIILAKDRHAKSKNRVRDTGLKINSVGKASEYGIHISKSEIARLTSRGKPKHKSRR